MQYYATMIREGKQIFSNFTFNDWHVSTKEINYEATGDSRDVIQTLGILRNEYSKMATVNSLTQICVLEVRVGPRLILYHWIYLTTPNSETIDSAIFHVTAILYNLS